MGWADCGTDSKGRPIGYGHIATCDFPGCEAEIDRGIAYACGGMHGEESHSCEGYFCTRHLNVFVEVDGQEYNVCHSCRNYMQASPDWVEDEEEGVWRLKE